MAEKESVFSSKIKYSGIFNFKDFYNFCYEWLTQETGLSVSEKAYKEKLAGDSKNIEVEWGGVRKLTDYFRFDAKVKFRVTGLTKVEITRNGEKSESNKGTVEITVGAELVRDYDGKFESTPFNKFMRSIYEKYIIPSRVSQFEDKISEDCDEFLSQAKAYLDLEGKK